MDTVSAKKRSEVMVAVKSSGTKLEHFFAEQLEARHLQSFEKNVKGLPGKPDFVFTDAKIAIFIDSCFWHGCAKHLRMPASNEKYWKAKISRNRRKDRQVTDELHRNGWVVLRIWEHSLKKPRALKWWLTRIENLLTAKKVAIIDTAICIAQQNQE